MKGLYESPPLCHQLLCTLPTCHADINPLHWGGSNTLAVGLGAAVYIWNADTGSINELHRLPFPSSYVTSLQWDARGRYLAIGTSDAEVQVSVVPSTVATAQWFLITAVSLACQPLPSCCYYCARYAGNGVRDCSAVVLSREWCARLFSSSAHLALHASCLCFVH